MMSLLDKVLGNNGRPLATGPWERRRLAIPGPAMDNCRAVLVNRVGLFTNPRIGGLSPMSRRSARLFTMAVLIASAVHGHGHARADEKPAATVPTGAVTGQV